MAETIRAFVAVTIPASRELAGVLQTLSAIGRPVRAVSPEHLHITLKFLGETEERLLPEIGSIVRTAADAVSAFELSIDGLGAFPHAGRPTVVWAGISDGEPLPALAYALETHLEPLGFEPDDRPFRPHLTLARIRGRAPDVVRLLLREHAATDFGRVAIESLELIRSDLQPDSPRYTTLVKAPLAAR